MENRNLYQDERQEQQKKESYKRSNRNEKREEEKTHTVRMKKTYTTNFERQR